MSDKVIWDHKTFVIFDTSEKMAMSEKFTKNENFLNKQNMTFMAWNIGLLLVFVEILPDKVILNHEMSYLVYFENFHFFVIFSFMQSN